MKNNQSNPYKDFIQNGPAYTARRAGKTCKLSPGVYDLVQDPNTGILYFIETETCSDGLIKLPSKEFSFVVDQIEKFLKPETRKLFDDYKFVYKRSALLYGDPGTGKTCIVNQVAEHVKNAGGVVLFNPNPQLMADAIQQINEIQPESTVVVIFEELDKLMHQHEGTLLSLLDGEVQKSNIIYMATTNYINLLPPRMMRPGRFSNLVEVGYPNLEVREYYLNTKLTDPSEVKAWAEKTEGFTIDELKELVLSVKCLGLDLEATIKRVRAIRLDKTVDPAYDEDADEGAPESLNNPFNYLNLVAAQTKRRGRI